jgi:hypothetical protein
MKKQFIFRAQPSVLLSHPVHNTLNGEVPIPIGKSSVLALRRVMHKSSTLFRPRLKLTSEMTAIGSDSVLSANSVVKNFVYAL